MPNTKEIPAAARQYLEQLELHLKQQVGVAPEEALSDAREFLLSAADALERSGEGPREDELYAHFVETLGEPSEVARQYAAQERPLRVRQGFAPGWRICCTKCGHSAPLATIGWTRIGARSVHKYTLGWCRQCRRLRFLRIIRDLDGATLTDQLGVTRTPDDLQRAAHHPWLTIGLILALVAAILLGMWLIVGLIAGQRVLAQDAGADANAVAIERLKTAIDQNYSYRDRKGVDWSKQIEEYRKPLSSAASADAFASKAAEMLTKAEDLHITLKVGDKLVGTYRRDMRPNFNPRLLPSLIPKLQQHGKTALVGELPDGIRYVAIGTWENREPASLDAAIAAVADSAQAKKPLIIDVRPNTGGDERLGWRVAGMFVGKPTPYAETVVHQSGQDLPMQQRVLQPNAKGIFHPGPCVVLMGNANVSSCEGFLLMMRAAGCKLIGGKSAGASGNPQPHDLGNGVTVNLPSWRSLSLEGRELEGVGITPDVVVDSKPEDFQKADPVLAKALAVLRGGG
jgi:hypothetical protein